MVWIVLFLGGIYVIWGVFSEKVREKTPWRAFILIYFASLMLASYLP